MAERSVPIDVLKVSYGCDAPDCLGRMIATGDVDCTTVEGHAHCSGYVHTCDRCGVTQTLPKSYPHLGYGDEPAGAMMADQGMTEERVQQIVREETTDVLATALGAKCDVELLKMSIRPLKLRLSHPRDWRVERVAHGYGIAFSIFERAGYRHWHYLGFRRSCG